MAAYSFLIDDSSQLGAIPGDDGWRCFLKADGTEERTRYFAVTFGKMFYKRFVQASIENDYDALPGIFMWPWFVLATSWAKVSDMRTQLAGWSARSSMQSGMWLK